MDRRDMIGALGALGFAAVSGSALRADHDAKENAGGKDMLAPVKGMHAHFCGIHIAKENPKFQLLAQHFCAPLNESMHQCLLFDSCEKNAKLLGVEYIISDALYQKLPRREKKYWHVHTYEVLAGGLIAPGMKPDDEMKFMKALLTTWGKTWHTWPDPQEPVPMGEPLLMWSVTGDGQLSDKLLAERDRQFNVSCAKIREERCKEIGYEVPKVSLPRSINEDGRQWCDDGDDKPTPIRK